MQQQNHEEAARRILALARERRFDELEDAWLAAVESDAFGSDHLRAVLDEVARLGPGAAGTLESLLWILLTATADRRGPAAAIAALEPFKDILPDGNVLRDELASLYRQSHATAPDISTLVEMTVLRKDLPLPMAVARLEKLLLMPPGTFVADSRRRTPGRVIGVDDGRKVLSVSFGDTQRAYDGAAVGNLDLCDPEDYRALVLFEPDRLVRLAGEDPAELARLVLKAHGPHMEYKEFKAALAPVVPAECWSKWWSAAKTRIRRSPHIEVTDAAHPSLWLRGRPVAYADRARQEFRETADLRSRLLLVLGHLRDTGHDPQVEGALLKEFASDLAEIVAGSAPARSPAERADLLALIAVLDEVRRRYPDAAGPEAAPAAGPLLACAADVAAALAALDDDPLALCVLAMIRRTMPDGWPEVYASAMAGASPEVCEEIAAALAEAGRHDLLASVASAAMRKPEQNVALMLWLWKAATADRFPEALAEVNRVSLTIRFLLAADDLGHRAQDDRRLRPLVAQIRSAVTARDGAVLRSVLEKADDSQAKDIRAAADRNAAFTEQVRARVLDVIRQTHPAHFAVRTVPPWEEDVIYTTAAALHRQEEVYGELVTKGVLKNQRALAEAAEHGDITENAEFTAALEERDRLAERAARMRADLAKARVISPSLAQGDTVTVGSRVRARNLATGQEEIRIFLGPWDADPSKHIYSYRAPLSLAFMGRRPGDIVVFAGDGGEQRWEILEVGPAL